MNETSEDPREFEVARQARVERFLPEPLATPEATETEVPSRVLDQLDAVLAAARRSREVLAVHRIAFRSKLAHLEIATVRRLLEPHIREADSCIVAGDAIWIVQRFVNQPDGITVLSRLLLQISSRALSSGGSTRELASAVGVAVGTGQASATSLGRRAARASRQALEDESSALRLDFSLVRGGADLLWELPAALAAGDLFVEYHAQFDLSNGAMRAYEALVRWKHPISGRMAAREFVPLLEENGLMPLLDDWVLERVLDDLEEHAPKVPVSVNLSASTLEDSAFASRVTSALRERALDPRMLELEMTERRSSLRSLLTVANLQSLRAEGVALALDEFGRGTNSLLVLRQLPVTKIKIPREFVRTEDEKGRVVLGAMVRLARELQIESVAEGVESEEQAELLRELGCSLAQGHWFSEPGPAFPTTD